MTAFAHCLDAVRNAGHVVLKPYDAEAFNNYLHWFHRSTCIELVNHAYEEELLEQPIMFDEVAQSQYDRHVRGGRGTSIASSLNFVVIYSLISPFVIHIGMCSLKLFTIWLSQRTEIQKTADECEVVWDQSREDENASSALRNFVKVWSVSYTHLRAHET